MNEGTDNDIEPPSEEAAYVGVSSQKRAGSFVGTPLQGE